MFWSPAFVITDKLSFEEWSNSGSQTGGTCLLRHIRVKSTISIKSMFITVTPWKKLLDWAIILIWLRNSAGSLTINSCTPWEQTELFLNGKQAKTGSAKSGHVKNGTRITASTPQWYLKKMPSQCWLPDLSPISQSLESLRHKKIKHRKCTLWGSGSQKCSTWQVNGTFLQSSWVLRMARSRFSTLSLTTLLNRPLTATWNKSQLYWPVHVDVTYSPQVKMDWFLYIKCLWPIAKGS